MLMIVIIIVLPVLPQKTEAVGGAVLKLVAGESADYVLQGIATKAGQAFSDSSALDKSRARWNLDGYQMAMDYEAKLSAEEKARWDNFNREIRQTPTPIPNKPNVGKVILSAGAFLTGLDLIYNAYQAFNDAYNGGVEGQVGYYGSSAYPYLNVRYVIRNHTTYAEYIIALTNGENINVSASLGGNWGTQLVPDSYTGFASVNGKNYVLVSHGYIDNGNYIAIGGTDKWHYFDRNVFPIGANQIIPSTVPITSTDLNLNVPTRLIPITNNGVVPDISRLYPNLDPNGFIEIEVPLTPTVPINTENNPITDEEYDRIIKNDDVPGPEPGTDPEPGTGIGTQLAGLFSKLWEWLKKILDAILSIPTLILSGLYDLLVDVLTALFVPDDGYFDTKFNQLRLKAFGDLDNDLDLTDWTRSGGYFTSVFISLMGVDNMKIVDADSINNNLNKIHVWVRGFFYPLLILYNINMAYKLIRGTSLIGIGRNNEGGKE